jgi:hypothetical protein
MTTDAPRAASSHRGGRAQLPGPRRVYLGAALIAIAIAAVVVLAIRPGRAASPPSAGGLQRPLTKRYGQTPKWLKIPEPAAVTSPVASAAKPDLGAMQGVPVAARLPGGSAKIFVEGPAVPGWVSNDASEGRLPEGASVPSTFSVSFSAVHGTVPLSAGQFTLITYQGKILHPAVKLAGGGSLPSALESGQTISLRLSVPVPEGDGAIRWAPNGRKILVSYFWTLEFD